MLDPALYGHPGAVNLSVDDYAQLDADAIRRSSSRARRPAAKVRERDGAEDEMSAILDGPPIANGQVATAGTRKRRAGGASGVRRRRKDASNGDGTYPNPPKRTRNARNNAFASPLAGPVITNETDLLVAEHTSVDRPSAAPDGEDVNGPAPAAEDLDGQEQRRSTRSRRTRPSTLKRRHSSASETTTTSVSVSIAANTRNTRSTGTRTQQDPALQEEAQQEDVEMKDESADGQVEQTDKTRLAANVLVEADHAQPVTAGPNDIGGKRTDVVLEEVVQPPSESTVIKNDENKPKDMPLPPQEPQPMDVDESAVPKPSRSSTELRKPSPVSSESIPHPPKPVSEAQKSIAEAENDAPPHQADTELQKADTPAPAREPQKPQENPDDRHTNKIVEKPPPQAAHSQPKELPIPHKPKIVQSQQSQKISPSSWTRFAAPAAGPTTIFSLSQKKDRDEEKEEGELSEESSGTPPRGR